MRLSFILARIAARASAGVWRHRIAWLGACFAVASLGLYRLTYAGATVAEGDCADTTMVAVTKGADERMAHAAYACLGPDLRVKTEDAFIAGLQERDQLHGRLTRIGDQRTSDGGRIVFFTVETQGRPAVGYIIYLDQQGKVSKVE